MPRKPTGNRPGRPSKQRPEEKIPDLKGIFKGGVFTPPGPGDECTDFIAKMRRWFETKAEHWPETLVKGLNEHLAERPFDLLRWGLLKIINKDAELVWFVLNDEQRVMLDYIEEDYYAGRPVRMIILKARQIGCTTFLKAVECCRARAESYLTIYCVADQKKKSAEHRSKVRLMMKHLPAPLRPATKSPNGFEFEDEVLGIEETKIIIDSAENGENVGIGFTIHHLNLSEGSHWRESAKGDVYTAIANCVPDRGRSMVFEESTGNQAEDVFYTRYWRAKKGQLGRYRAIFFSWFHHYENRLPLEEGIAGREGLSEAAFWESLDEQDLEIVRTYRNLDGSEICAEQMNWYITKREEQAYDASGASAEKFRRENPSCEEEAFLGGGSTYFDNIHVNADRMRTKNPIYVKLADLPDCCNAPDMDGERIRVARASIMLDLNNRCSGAKFYDDAAGDWLVFERPRAGHRYIISADPAKGKMKLKNVRASQDYSTVEVGRHTYEKGEVAESVQVALYRKQFIKPDECARQAVAASVVYRDQINGDRCLIIHDAVGHGAAFTDEADDLGANFYHQVKRDKQGAIVSDTVGFEVTGGVRAEGAKSVVYNKFRSVYHQRLYRVNAHITALELGTFAEINGKLDAIPPHHDDTVTSAVLQVEGWRYLEGRHFAPSPVIAHERALRLLSRRGREADGEEGGDMEEPRPISRVDKDWRARQGMASREVHASDDGEIIRVWGIAK